MGNRSSSPTPAEAAASASVSTALLEAEKVEVCSDELLARLSFAEGGVIKAKSVPLIYSDHYNITFMGLEKLHPFDSAKYSKIHKFLTDTYKLIPASSIHTPIETPTSVLRMVHPKSYIDSLTSSIAVAKILEVPPVAVLPNSIVQSRALRPMRFATGGTLLGTELALRQQLQQPAQPSVNEGLEEAKGEPVAASSSSSSSASSSSSSSSPPLSPPAHNHIPGWSINLGGGFHHCSARSGGGFCPYADISLALIYAAKKFGVTRAFILDCDAHQGNGHENDKRNGVYEQAGLDVFIMDMYNSGIYPFDNAAKSAIDCEVRLQSGTADEEYLGLLRKHLDQSLKRFKPQFLLYNAGTDCLAGDPLGHLDVSAEGIMQRDLIVFEMCAQMNIPILMVLSGGYQLSNAEVIARSIRNLQQQLHLWQAPPEAVPEEDLGSCSKLKKKKKTKGASKAEKEEVGDS